jgi:putative spermidine/putrescine transport system substrate-binding protein
LIVEIADFDRFLMGLPYILGDKDPKDPEKGWDKTWA